MAMEPHCINSRSLQILNFRLSVLLLAACLVGCRSGAASIKWL